MEHANQSGHHNGGVASLEEILKTRREAAGLSQA
jgi:hypothetical protein